MDHVVPFSLDPLPVPFLSCFLSLPTLICSSFLNKWWLCFCLLAPFFGRRFIRVWFLESGSGRLHGTWNPFSFDLVSPVIWFGFLSCFHFSFLLLLLLLAVVVAVDVAVVVAVVLLAAWADFRVDYGVSETVKTMVVVWDRFLEQFWRFVEPRLWIFIPLPPFSPHPTPPHPLHLNLTGLSRFMEMWTWPTNGYIWIIFYLNISWSGWWIGLLRNHLMGWTRWFPLPPSLPPLPLSLIFMTFHGTWTFPVNGDFLLVNVPNSLSLSLFLPFSCSLFSFLLHFFPLSLSLSPFYLLLHLFSNSL